MTSRFTDSFLEGRGSAAPRQRGAASNPVARSTPSPWPAIVRADAVFGGGEHALATAVTALRTPTPSRSALGARLHSCGRGRARRVCRPRARLLRRRMGAGAPLPITLQRMRSPVVCAGEPSLSSAPSPTGAAPGANPLTGARIASKTHHPALALREG